MYVDIYNWHREIPAEKRDPDMAEKIAHDPDFLIWLADGLRRARDRGPR